MPEGKIVDFLTGKHVKDTPEEYVRQNIEKALVYQYHHEKADCEPEVKIKVGASKKRVDIIIFEAGTSKRTPTPIDRAVRTHKCGASAVPDQPIIGEWSVAPFAVAHARDHLPSLTAPCRARYALGGTPSSA